MAASGFGSTSATYECLVVREPDAALRSARQEGRKLDLDQAIESAHTGGE